MFSGLEINTRPLVLTSASGCRASGNFDISSENYFFISYIPINFEMQGKWLFKIFWGLFCIYIIWNKDGEPKQKNKKKFFVNLGIF